MPSRTVLLLATGVLAFALVAGVLVGPLAVPIDGDDGSNATSGADGVEDAGADSTGGDGTSDGAETGSTDDARDDDSGTVEVGGGDLESDPDELFAWTTDAMEANPAAPTVRIEEMQSRRHPIRNHEFQQLLVLDDPDADLPERPVTASASRDLVLINEDRLAALQDPEDPPHEDDVLVHEFVHVVQIHADYSPDAGGYYGITSDHDMARTALIEGGAEYVADEYAEGAVLEQWEEDWAQMDAERRYVRWPYYRGAQYVDARVDDPAELLELERPPTTAEMLRREAPASDTPAIELADDHGGYSASGHDRLGAATVEVALSRELSVDRSRTVAAGLRADVYRQYDLGAEADRDGHVWAIQWQDPAAADAFADAMGAYLDGRGTTAGDRWRGVGGTSFRLERPDDRTVAVLAGTDAFLANTTVRGEDGEYAVAGAGVEGAAQITAAPVPEAAGDLVTGVAVSSTVG